jgi:hypothetical protein
MDDDDLDAISVVIVEGEHPGSTYYAAELEVELDIANKVSFIYNVYYDDRLQ